MTRTIAVPTHRSLSTLMRTLREEMAYLSYLPVYAVVAVALPCSKDRVLLLQRLVALGQNPQ